LAVSPDDLKAISDVARDLAYRHIDAQLQASDNFDAKALGVLAFDGAALAAILADNSLFNGHWVIPALLVSFSGLFAILMLQKSGWDLGPDPKEFYEDEESMGLGVGSAARANVDLVSELGGPTGSISGNETILRRRSWFYGWALWTTVFAGVAGAILIAQPR
jgi:hypothetical protein